MGACREDVGNIDCCETELIHLTIGCSHPPLDKIFPRIIFFPNLQGLFVIFPKYASFSLDGMELNGNRSGAIWGRGRHSIFPRAPD